jgi:hypothetical protein
VPHHPDALAGNSLDPATLDQAVREYRTSRRRAVRWASVLGFPLSFVLIGATIAIGGGPIAGGLFISVVGVLLSWYPARKIVRSFQRYFQVRPVIRRYEEALGAAQPDPHRGRAAINRWRRDNDLFR